MTPGGFPHSEISGSKAVCASPELIAACRVLRRLPVPRHPPCALDIFFSCRPRSRAGRVRTYRALYIAIVKIQLYIRSLKLFLALRYSAVKVLGGGVRRLPGREPRKPDAAKEAGPSAPAGRRLPILISNLFVSGPGEGSFARPSADALASP